MQGSHSFPNSKHFIISNLVLAEDLIRDILSRVRIHHRMAKPIGIRIKQRLTVKFHSAALRSSQKRSRSQFKKWCRFRARSQMQKS